MTAEVGSMKRRTGFSLVELLVVITIIGILVGMLMPAVQSAREAARQTQCRNNLKQLSLACLSHLEAEGFFPHGGWGFECVGLANKGFNINQPGGWIYNILPFMEASNLHNLGVDTSGNIINSQLIQLVDTPLAVLNCPTRRRAVTYTPGPSYWQPHWATPLVGCARSDYAINGGVYAEHSDQGGSSNPNSNLSDMTIEDSSGVAGCLWVCTAAAVTDGVSNTYLLGEKYIDPDHYFDAQDYGDNENAYIGCDRDTMRFDCYPPMIDTHGADPNYAFGSAHLGNFNMSFCDGSVRSISYSINQATHQNLCNRQDHNVVILP
jgi:prepilin-type N-terminal cleavage/methylation domain-containing protein/prepilin-type processing-associated H-X9-DG protein